MKIGAGISEDTGRRDKMEDEYAIYDRPDIDFFSAEVYDGHGGREAAYLTSEMLTPHFLNAWFPEVNKSPDDRRSDQEILREAYIAADEYIAFRKIRGGTAAVTLYIMGDRFLAANTGDSRAIIGTKSGVEVLTLDHKPDVPDETARIEALGGMVTSFGAPRVMGFLAMSRALGDTDLRPFVTCEPRIAVGILGRENDFAVLACDGVWDVLSSDTVIRLAREGATPQHSAETIKNTALDQGSSDNITVIVLDLRSHTKTLAHKEMKILSILDKAVPSQDRREVQKK
jgi:serine/threonine protein phosphatase PrpC